MLDFGKLNNHSNCSCISRNSTASHTKLCDVYLKGLGKATVVMRAQMSKIAGHKIGSRFRVDELASRQQFGLHL